MEKPDARAFIAGDDVQGLTLQGVVARAPAPVPGLAKLADAKDVTEKDCRVECGTSVPVLVAPTTEELRRLLSYARVPPHSTVKSSRRPINSMLKPRRTPKPSNNTLPHETHPLLLPALLLAPLAATCEPVSLSPDHAAAVNRQRRTSSNTASADIQRPGGFGLDMAAVMGSCSTARPAR